MTAMRVVMPRPCHPPAGTSGSPTWPAFDLVPPAGALSERRAVNAAPGAGDYAAASTRRRLKHRVGSPLCASHRNEIQVGHCPDHVLAAKTAAASSAILRHENTNAKESIVEELLEIDVEAAESEEHARVYAW